MNDLKAKPSPNVVTSISVNNIFLFIFAKIEFYEKLWRAKLGR